MERMRQNNAVSFRGKVKHYEAGTDNEVVRIATYKTPGFKRSMKWAVKEGADEYRVVERVEVL